VEALYQNLLNINEHETNLPDLPVFTGILSEKEVIIARCGIGKVNAALATQYIINTFNPDFIINTGVAGGVSPKVRIADLLWDRALFNMILMPDISDTPWVQFPA